MTSQDQFAVRELQKHGWNSGKGLGRLENGMKDAIKVKLKNNKGGVGHDPGSDFTFHWWDHIFNKAANSIKVTSSGDEVKIEKDKDAKKLQPTLTYNKKLPSSKLSSKPLLYGTFVKSGTFIAGEEDKKVVVSSESDDSSDTDNFSATDTLEKTYKLTGLTGHKGARHGHKMCGKLQRIENQEQSELKYVNAKNIPEEVGILHKKHRKGKKKRKRESISILSFEDKNEESIHTNGDTEENEVATKKQKKKKKNKNVE